MKRLFGVALCTGALVLSCTEGPPTPTGTEIPDLPTAQNANPPGEPPENSPDPKPKQAYGQLRIEENYGQCIQSTDYPLDYMSVFRVSESGSQSRVALYKSAEGTLPCGVRIQVDCTVRDPNPTPGAISAYDLYGHFVGELVCPPPPPPPPPTCVDCPSPPLCSVPPPRPEGEECYLDETTCTWKCQPPSECELPGPGSQQFEGGNPWPSDVAECGNFGLVPGPGGFYITKCGLYFQWGPFFPTSACDNGQDISHITECQCKEDDDSGF